MGKTKPKSRDNILTPEERERICKVCVNEQERLAVYGLLYTGMRESELLHMRKSWMDFKNGIINVPLTDTCRVCSECRKSRTRKGKLVKATDTWRAKTPHAERPIPIVPELKPVLDEFFSKHNSIMELLWYRQNIWKIVKEVGRRAKIRHPIFPHCFRATFATILVEKGLENPVTLKDILGWTKIDMATIYIKLGGVGMKKRVDEIW